MSLRLRAGLSWCLSGGQSVFLDLARDRYFCLPPETDRAFRRWVAGEAISPVERDRLVAASVLMPGERAGHSATFCPPALRDLGLERSGEVHPLDVMMAAASQLRARFSLWRAPIARLVSHLAAGRPAVPLGPDRAAVGLRCVALAFRAATLLLRAQDQCLPRAIAARRLCARHGLEASLVFGVRLDPFTAHSWVQAGDAVVVGDLEQVRLFTPILVVP